MSETYYDILGISRNADPKEVKKAYRKQTKRFHPDASGQPDVEKFLKVKEAYETLSDPEKRRQYDRLLEGAPRLRGTGPDPRYREPFSTGPWMEVILSPWEARRGINLPLVLERAVECPSCGGRGYLRWFPCMDCLGEGEIVRHVRHIIRIPSGVRDGTRLYVDLGRATMRICVVIRICEGAFDAGI